jgi:anaerobic selenocysteine-containing dehydrogenase
MPPLVATPEPGTAALEAARTHHTACPLDCPDACGLTVEVEDGRVTRVGASDAHPYTAGFICAKVGHFPRHMYSPERLLHPGRRVGAKGEGRFERLSWDAALDLVAAQMRAALAEWGGEAILPLSYGGSNGLLTQDTTDARLFRRLGASRLQRTVCAAPSRHAAAGLYGRMAGVALSDYRHARLIVLWGVNASVSGIHLVPVVQEARRAGARLVVVDPRRTPLAAKADLHLAPRPGSDVALALALHNWLFAEGHADLDFLSAHATGVEELRRRAAAWPLARAAEVCGLALADVERFARLYAESSPAAIRCGWGVERNRNGGGAVAAVIALPAVGGKFGVRGGGYTMSNSGAYRGIDNERAIGEPEPPARQVNMNLLGRTLLAADDPPVGVLFVYNANPLATLPNQELVRQGLAREDLFTVVFDQVLTDTARYADLVLPATTFLEHEELVRGYGAFVVQRAAPAVGPVGEARGNVEVFAALCRRLGLGRPGEPETADELAAAILPDRLREELAGPGVALPDSGPAPVQFVDVFPNTPDRKVHLVPAALDRQAPGGLYAFRDDPATARFPLALLSPATQHTISSTFGQLRRGKVALEIHPADAAARGIADGDPVRVWNELGEVRTTARLSADLRHGVVFLPKGLWSHNTDSGTTANALVPDTLTDLGGGACFNDARVEVERG